MISNIGTFTTLAALAALAGVLVWRDVARLAARVNPSWLIFGVALGGRLITLGADPLWYDEAYTALITARPWGDLITATAGDVHPPLFYLLTRLVVLVLGNAEWALRLLPAFLGAGVCLLVFVLAREWLDTRAALVAQIMAALLPGLLRYSQESRMYTLLAFLLLLALYYGRRGRWLGYTAAAGLALYTHYYAGLYLLAIQPLIMRRGDRRYWLAQGLAVLSFAPWGLALLAQVRAVSGGYWILRPDVAQVIGDPVLTLIVSFRMPAALTLITLAAVLAVMVAAGRATLRRLPGLWLVIAGPPLWAALASLVVPIYLSRGLILSACLLPIPVAAWLKDKPRALWAALGVLLAVMVTFYYFPAQNGRAELRPALAGLPDSGVWFHSDAESWIIFSYYRPGAEHVLLDYAATISNDLSAQTRRSLGIVTSSAPPPLTEWIVTTETLLNDEYQAAFNATMAALEPVAVVYDDDKLRVRVYRVAE